MRNKQFLLVYIQETHRGLCKVTNKTNELIGKFIIYKVDTLEHRAELITMNHGKVRIGFELYIKQQWNIFFLRQGYDSIHSTWS